MAWSIVQTASTSGTSGGFNLNINPTGSGNLLVITIVLYPYGPRWDSAQQTEVYSSVASINNGFSSAGVPASVNFQNDSTYTNRTSEIWYCQNCSSNITNIQGNYSWNNDGLNTTYWVYFYEVSGIVTSSSIDVSSSFSNGAYNSTPYSPSITTNYVGDFIVAVAGAGLIGGMYSGNEFTEDSSAGSNGFAHITSTSATAGNHQTVWQSGASDAWCSSIVAFKSSIPPTLTASLSDTVNTSTGDDQLNYYISPLLQLLLDNINSGDSLFPNIPGLIFSASLFDSLDIEESGSFFIGYFAYLLSLLDSVGVSEATLPTPVNSGSPAWGIVQNLQFTTAITSSPGTWNISSTGSGNLLICCVTLQAGSITSVKTGGGTSFTNCGASDGSAAGFYQYIYYLPNCASGTTSIVVNASAFNNIWMQFYEVSGIVTTSPLDTYQYKPIQTASSTYSAPQITTGAAGDFVVAMCQSGNSPNGLTGGSSFTQDYLYNNSFVAHLTSNTVGASVNEQAQWTSSFTQTYAGCCAAFFGTSSASLAANLPVSLQDTIHSSTGDDQISVLLNCLQNLIDNIDISGDVSTYINTLSLVLNIFDLINTSEEIDTYLPILQSIFDTIQVSENLSLLLFFMLSLIDSITTSDATSLQYVFLSALFDSISTSEAILPTPVIIGASPTGGTITTVGGNTINTFTNSDTFVVPTGMSGNVNVLVVGGGGGGGINGGNFASGGGGGGGYVSNTSYAVSAGSYSVSVGGGGGVASDGSNSSFGSIIAYGGGHGSGYPNLNGGNGGCGGGGTGDGGIGAEHGGSGSQGGSGAAGGYYAYSGGGGGGAGETPARNGDYQHTGGNGGSGISNNISGNSVFYAGGGAGGGEGTYSGGNGGNGGGGAGGNNSSTPSNGATNTGGGGGGGENGSQGGSGIVIVSYPTGSLTFPSYVLTVLQSLQDNILTSTNDDQVSVLLLCLQLLIDNINISEEVDLILGLVLSLIDNINVSEDISPIFQILLGLLFDNINISENIDDYLTFLLALIDNINVSENIIPVFQILFNLLFDNINISEEVDPLIPFVLSLIVDEIQVGEDISEYLVLFQSLLDTIRASEASYTLLPILQSLVDNINTSTNDDQINVNLSILQLLFDNIVMSEYLPATTQYDIFVIDTILTSESVSESLIFLQFIVDTIAVSENISQFLPFLVQTLIDNIDTSVGDDQVSVDLSVLQSLFDSVQISEDLSPLIANFAAILEDDINISEFLFDIQTFTALLTDIILTSEILTPLLPYLVESLIDNVLIQETVTGMLPFLVLSLADQISVGEEVDVLLPFLVAAITDTLLIEEFIIPYDVLYPPGSTYFIVSSTNPSVLDFYVNGILAGRLTIA